ncbi:MAG: Crp/Fnr family transcriptional regulator [Methylobacteriaceae bacterium]|nr:Crp/Fnr family transcriptional regulator [Methylobacteriaceae bacterium]MBV9247457.1 Crp/Fnr family transcriptional regulator [Methylobacteriaceae bacterium]MBV9633844.1 Crp/Fnr family transcriptional regulator [Methylobacteriaceae bacterium]
MAFEVEVKTLQRVPFFRDVDPAKLKLLAYVGEKLTYAQGESVFRQGSLPDGVYVILAGEVEIFHDTAAGDHVQLVRFGEGMSFGEMSVLSGKARSVTAVAATKLSVLRIKKNDFVDLVRQVPQLAFAIIRELSQRLEMMITRFSTYHSP